MNCPNCSHPVPTWQVIEGIEILSDCSAIDSGFRCQACSTWLMIEYTAGEIREQED